MSFLAGTAAAHAVDWNGAREKADRAPELLPALGLGVPVNQGPITFSEIEFFPGEVIPVYPQSVVVNTLDGAPIPEVGMACFALAAPFLGEGGEDDCTVNGGPGPQLYVQPPGIEGPTLLRAVTIGFHVPTTAVRFGFTASCPAPPASPIEITWADEEGLFIETTQAFLVDTGFDFPEVQVAYEPPAGTRVGGLIVVATALDADKCGRFFLDNLEYEGELPATVLEIPTLSPAGLAVFGVAFALLAGSRLRMRRARANRR